MFGGAIHRALAAHYKALMVDEEPPGAEELQAVFSDSWDADLEGDTPVLFSDKESPDKLKDAAVGMLAAFTEKVERPHRVVGVEEAFSIELVNERTGEALPRFTGVLDAITQDEGGDYHILEHKTAARRWSKSRLDRDLQLSAYSLAARYQGLGDATVDVQVLLKTKVPDVEVLHATRTDRDRQDFIDTAAGVLTAVKAGVSYPVRDWWCSGCPFQSRCLTG